LSCARMGAANKTTRASVKTSKDRRVNLLGMVSSFVGVLVRSVWQLPGRLLAIDVRRRGSGMHQKCHHF
jgi:hypothetical protein